VARPRTHRTRQVAQASCPLTKQSGSDLRLLRGDCRASVPACRYRKKAGRNARPTNSVTQRCLCELCEPRLLWGAQAPECFRGCRQHSIPSHQEKRAIARTRLRTRETRCYLAARAPHPLCSFPFCFSFPNSVLGTQLFLKLRFPLFAFVAIQHSNSFNALTIPFLPSPFFSLPSYPTAGCSCWKSGILPDSADGHPARRFIQDRLEAYQPRQPRWLSSNQPAGCCCVRQ
jgi:hypothetical protein